MEPLRCFLIGHDPKVTDDEVLGDGDFVEVATECTRCSWSQTDILVHAGDE